MALDSIVRGVASGLGAEVNADNELRVALSTVPADAGYAKMLDADGGPLRVTENEYLLTTGATVIFTEQVDGTTLNFNQWLTSNTTQTVDINSGFIRLNASALTTVSTSAILMSIKTFPLYGTMPLKVTFNAKVNTAPIANATIDLGVGVAAGTAAPTDGCYFRWSPAGTFLAVINNNGTETTSGPLTAPPVNDSTLFDIEIVEDLVRFSVDDVMIAEVLTPVALSYPTGAGRLTLYARTLNGGSSPATAPILQIGQVTVDQQVMSQNKLWKEILVSQGRGAYQGPAAASLVQTANHVNSTSPTSATLSNTTAGYTTMGGRYQFAAPAGAVTDFNLFQFQIPGGFQLFVTGVVITAMNTGAAVATTATILDWSVAVNNSATNNLATAEGPPATWAPRRLPLGMSGFVIAAGIGQSAPDIVRAFDPPLVCDSGRFLNVIVQVPVGTATASQVVRGDVLITGYFE